MSHREMPTSTEETARLFQIEVEAGIARGLHDVAQGCYTQMNAAHLDELRKRLQSQKLIK